MCLLIVFSLIFEKSDYIEFMKTQFTPFLDYKLQFTPNAPWNMKFLGMSIILQLFDLKFVHQLSDLK